MNKKPAIASLVRGPQRYANIRKALELIKPDLDHIRTKRRILIKPNLTATKKACANTDSKAVEAVLDFLLENFQELNHSEFIILEGSGSAYYEKTTTMEVFRNFGYLELIKKYRNVKLECVEDMSDFVEFRSLSVAGAEKARLVKRFFDFDFRISIAVPKTHNYAIATFGIKNMAGLIKQEDKSLLHGLRTPSAPGAKTIFTYIPTSVIAWMRRRAPDLVNLFFKNSIAYLKAMKVIHQNVFNLAKVTWPDLVVLDGFYYMDGSGPIDGYPVEMGVAIASTDPLKADAIAVRLMGLEPQDIGYLYYISEAGIGDNSLAGLIGDDPDTLRRKFKMHPTYNIQKGWRA